MATINPNIDPRTGKWNKRDPFSGRFASAKQNLESIARRLEEFGGDFESAMEASLNALGQEYVFIADKLYSAIPEYTGNLRDSIGVALIRGSRLVHYYVRTPRQASEPQRWGATINHGPGQGWASDFIAPVVNEIAQYDTYATKYMHKERGTTYRVGYMMNSMKADMRIALFAAMPYATDLDLGESPVVRGRHQNWFNGLQRQFIARVRQSISEVAKLYNGRISLNEENLSRGASIAAIDIYAK